MKRRRIKGRLTFFARRGHHWSGQDAQPVVWRDISADQNKLRLEWQSTQREDGRRDDEAGRKHLPIMESRHEEADWSQAQ